MSAGSDPVGTYEIVCSNEQAAQAEAARQQIADSSDAEWIYLRNANGQWVARRTLRGTLAPVSMRKAFLEWLTNPFNWLAP